MIIADKKKAVTTILSKLKPSGESASAPVKPEEAPGADPAMQAMAEDFMTAMESKSVTDLASVFQSLKDMILAGDEPSEDEQE